MKNLSAAFLLLAFAGPASSAAALSLDGGISQVAGNSNYAGTSAFAKITHNGCSLTPSFSQYHSDSSSGTYQTFSLRGGYDTKLYGFGVTVGGTPRVNGYTSSFVGVDGVISLTPTGGSAPDRIRGSQQGKSGASGSGLARIDLSGAVTYIKHHDALASGNVARAQAVNIGQTNLNGAVGVSVLKNLISVDITKFVYDHNLAVVAARPAGVQNLTGLSAAVQGFPNTSTSVRLQTQMLPLVTPFVSYTHTVFALNQPHTDAYTVGGYVEFEIVEVTASYQRYASSGGLQDQNYYSLGASLRF